MGCASTKGAVPATGNGNVPEDPAEEEPTTVYTPTDTLKPPEVIIEGEAPPKTPDNENEVDPSDETGESPVDDGTDEAIHEIQLAVPEVPDGSDTLPDPDEIVEPEEEPAEEEDKPEDEVAEDSMDTNEVGDEGPKVIAGIVMAANEE